MSKTAFVLQLGAYPELEEGSDAHKNVEHMKDCKPIKWDPTARRFTCPCGKGKLNEGAIFEEFKQAMNDGRVFVRLD